MYTSVDKSRVLSLLYHTLLCQLQISKGTAQVHFLECCVVIGAVTAICKTLHCNAKGTLPREQNPDNACSSTCLCNVFYVR